MRVWCLLYVFCVALLIVVLSWLWFVFVEHYLRLFAGLVFCYMFILMFEVWVSVFYVFGDFVVLYLWDVCLWLLVCGSINSVVYYVLIGVV